MDNVEELAKLLHESGREAVEKRLVYRDDLIPVESQDALGLPIKPFCEWADLPEPAREGRRVQARYLVVNSTKVMPLLSMHELDPEYARSLTSGDPPSAKPVPPPGRYIKEPW